MILCLKCWQLWPRGTVYCGCCGGTLGKRICPEGHESNLRAKCCSTCGSPKLSKGASCLTLRPLTWIASLVLFILIWHRIALPAIGQLYAFSLLFLIRALDSILGLAVWSWLMGLLLGEKAQKVIFAFWLGIVKALVGLLANFGKIVFFLLRRMAGFGRK